MDVVYDKDKMVISDSFTGKVLASGPQIGGLWWVKLTSLKPVYINHVLRNEDLWHHRLGHQGWKYSKFMVENEWAELPSGLLFKEKEFCAGCAKGS